MINVEQLWDLMLEGSDDLASELDLPSPHFTPRALGAIDDWVAEHDGALDEDDLSRLTLFLARVLIETHGGGLTQIQQNGHPLDGEWAASGFNRGLAPDYHVPFAVSAARIGGDGSLSAVEWYQKLLDEGR